MDTIAALRRRVKAVYKPRTRRNRGAKLRNLRMEIEETRKVGTSPTLSHASDTAVASAVGADHERTSSNDDPVEDECPQAEDVTPVQLDNADEESEAHGNHRESTTPTTGVQERMQVLVHASSVHFAHEQAVRDQFYVSIYDEQLDDYTFGPVRVVRATDGLKECPGLLMTLDFSVKVQKAVQAEREYTRLERSLMRQVEVVLHFEADLSREIANHRSRLIDFADAEDRDTVKEATLREELSTLEDMLQGAKCERKSIWSLLESRATILRELQTGVMAHLDDAFVYATLLEPEQDRPDTPIEDRDLRREYQAFRQRGRSPHADEYYSPLDVSRDRPQAPPLTAEEQVKQEVVNAFWKAHDRLVDAQHAFDRKEHTMFLGWQAHVNAVERGEIPQDSTREDFDLRWLKQGQELIHELLVAEEEFAAAKAKAEEAELNLTIRDQLSVSVGGEGDRTSIQEESIEAAPEPKVTNWLTSLSDPLSPGQNETPVEADEWESRDVEISDSISVVAEGADRKRIDEWRKACLDSMSEK